MFKMKELYEKVAADSILQAKFFKIMEYAQIDGMDATIKKLTDFAEEAKYDVTLEEMKEFFRDMTESKDRVLSDSELDMVAGGKINRQTLEEIERLNRLMEEMSKIPE
ncbi:MAG: hypothetical protein PHE79_10815 [Eubacteriales bacterium]|nr:hypothetical protein [Eubacteriales bacterium]